MSLELHTHWAFGTERQQEPQLRHLGNLPFSVCPSAQSEDVKSRKGPATSPTLCMVKLQSRGEQNFCHVVTMSGFLPRQARSSSPPISTLHPGHAAGLCGGWRAQRLRICCFWVG